MNTKGIIGNKDIKGLLESFVSLSLLRGLSYITPLISIPYVIDVIGIENFGLINFSLSLSLYFGAIIQYGFNITAVRNIARNKSNLSKLASIYQSTLNASIALTILSFVLFLMVMAVLEFHNFWLYLGSFILVSVQSALPIWFFQGVEKMRHLTMMNILSNVVYLVLLFVVIKERDDYYLIHYIQALAVFFTMAYAVLIVRKKFNICLGVSSCREVKEVLLNSKDAFLSQLAPNMYNNSSLFLLGLFGSHSQVGYYSLAVKVIDFGIAASQILSNVFIPFLSRHIKYFFNIEKIMISTGLLVTFLIWFFSESIVIFFVKAGSLEAISYVQYFSLSILFIHISMTYGQNFLMLIKQENLVKNITLYSSLFYLFVALLVIPEYQAIGAIIIVMSARFTIAILRFLFHLKYRHTIGTGV